MTILLLFLFLCAFAGVVLESILLWRISGKLVETDEVFERIFDLLMMYRANLRELSRGEVLNDHPEVMGFARLNDRMLSEVDSLVQMLNQQRASGRLRRESKLPPPDVV